MSKTAEAPKEICLYVSPAGNDGWTGRLAAPNRAKSDGPFATVHRAQRELRKIKGRKPLAQPVRIVLRGGTYFLPRPLVLDTRDSGTGTANTTISPLRPQAPVTFAAYEGEQPILSGGRRITGLVETTIHGRRAWMAKIPAVKSGRWNFHQLWVNGRRARRPRWPHKGLLRMENAPGITHQDNYNKGSDTFIYKAGDIPDAHNIQDVNVVVLHFWIDTRRKIKSIDTAQRLVTMEAPSRLRLTDDYLPDLYAEYYLDNVFEGLDEPGQWYLDRPAGVVYYLPLEGERIERAEMIAPVLSELLRIEGQTAPVQPPAKKSPTHPAPAGEPAREIHFEGITLSHNEWVAPSDAERLSTPQSAVHVAGAVNLRNAKRCTFRRCRVTHCGGYGIELTAGCSDVDILHSEISDLGAGGVKVWHGCVRNTISDCEISHGGDLWHTGVGVVIGRASGNKLLHCHIHNFDYSGISVGWTWGYAESEAYGNIIEFNHVHDIGRGVLSDMGGIYTLGVSGGTRIRNNVFHDIESRGYGGWAIYTDEGSTDILIENNLAYRTKSAGFHQHYGRDNMVRNNIFALGREKQVMRSRVEGHNTIYFQNNIVYFNQGELLGGQYSALEADFARNLYFDARGGKMLFAGKTFRQWQAFGADKGSLIADPLFVNPAKGDFRLRDGSPAAKIGFVPFDVSKVGPR